MLDSLSWRLKNGAMETRDSVQPLEGERAHEAKDWGDQD